MNKIPTIQASLTLLPELKRGRSTPLCGYMPHIVIGPTDQRLPKLEGNSGVERYQGVVLMDENLQIQPGETTEVTMGLMYYQAPANAV